MGSTYIQGFIEQGVELEKALYFHLRGNHFPPVHPDFIPTCVTAINKCNEEDYEYEIEMPNGITKKAYEIIEGLRLESFLENLEW